MNIKQQNEIKRNSPRALGLAQFSQSKLNSKRLRIRKTDKNNCQD